MAVQQTSDSTSSRRGGATSRGAQGDILLEIHGLRVEGQTDDVWHEIVKGIDLTVRRGEVLGLRRKDVDELSDTQVPLMPENLLEGLRPQEVADLVEFVKHAD